MKYLICFLFLSIGLNSFSQKLTGTWKGVGLQVDGQSWDVVLEYKDDKNILISYPGLGCSGIWILESTKENTYIFKEQIEVGTDKCDQGGEVHVQKIGKKKLKAVYYLRSYDPNNPIAEGELKRKKKK